MSQYYLALLSSGGTRGTLVLWPRKTGRSLLVSRPPPQTSQFTNLEIYIPRENLRLEKALECILKSISFANERTDWSIYMYYTCDDSLRHHSLKDFKSSSYHPGAPELAIAMMRQRKWEAWYEHPHSWKINHSRCKFARCNARVLARMGDSSFLHSTPGEVCVK